MNPEEYRTMRALEDTFWWYQALRRNVARYLTDALGESTSPPRMLDAGCGTGGTLATLHKNFPQSELIGLDLYENAARLTLDRGVTSRIVQGSINKLPFPDAGFDAVISLDVLYHTAVEEDVALAELRRVLKPGGPLLLNLAAFEALRGPHDTAVHGIRRYTPARVRALAQQQALGVDFLTCWNMTLAPLVWARRRLRSAKSSEQSDLQPTAPWVNTGLRMLADIEWYISRILPLPFGTSVFAILRRPVDS